MTTPTRNPHAGLPFTDDDATIATALDDVSVPALLCSLVHLTGDPAWIRGDVRPRMPVPTDFQSGIPPEECARVRARAVEAIAAFRDRGCELPPPPSPELVVEMMSFIGCEQVKPEFVPMFLDDLHLTSADTGAITWGDEIDAARGDSHTIVIGCGESGILAGIRLQQAGIPFTIIDKNAGPGGTWWENHYPGSRVDIPSHFYCYSFEPAHHWSEYFARQPELREYFVRILRERDLERHTRFRTRVTAATWDAPNARWRVEVVDDTGTTEVLDARFVVSAVGSLNVPKLPDIPGMESFAGPSFHSARWDHDVDHRGTRFALVGAGATGFQIAPTIADEVEHLTVFQRTAQWMFPNPVYHRAVPNGDAWAMRHLPFYARWYRFQIFYPASGLSAERLHIDPEWHDPDGLTTVSEMNAQRRRMLAQWIESQLADRPDILERVMPDYPTSGKRMLQDNGSWLQALKKPNVELVRTGIERIVPEGIVTVDGVLHPADVICYATGFRPYEALSPMHVVGRDGAVLRDQWGNEPTAYLGITVPNFPNFFCLYGPGTSLSVGASLIFQSERQVTFVLAAIRETLASGHRAIEVRREVADDYAARYRVEADRLVQSHPSVKHSHYKNDAGRIFTLNPWPVPTYWRWTQRCEPAEFEFS